MYKRQVPSRSSLRLLREGVELEDGCTAPANVAMPQDGVMRITIHEGRNRQVRRMCAAIGHPVQRLVRVRIGSIKDPSLRVGTARRLSVEEVRSLYEATTNS